MTIEQRIRELGLPIAGEVDPRAIEADPSLAGAVVVAEGLTSAKLIPLEKDPLFRLIPSGRSHTIVAEPF